MPYITSSSQIPGAGWGQRCQPPEIMSRVNFGTIAVPVHPGAAQAFRALSELFAREYGRNIQSCHGYSCRQVKGTNSWSWHAWGLAVDIDGALNPWQSPLVTVIPRSLRDMSRIKTVKNGLEVFTWGGIWSRPDSMHYQIRVHRDDLSQGVETPLGRYTTALTPPPVPPVVKPPTNQEELQMLPIKQGDGVPGTAREFKKTDVAACQAMLNAAYGAGLTSDGVYGQATVAAVQKFLGGSGSQIYGNIYAKLLYDVGKAAARSVR